MQKIEFINMAQSPDPGTLDKYKTFTTLLSASKQDTLQTLFSNDLDPVAMVLDFTGLEDDTP